jgi:hypothetical protein
LPSATALKNHKFLGAGKQHIFPEKLGISTCQEVAQLFLPPQLDSANWPLFMGISDKNPLKTAFFGLSGGWKRRKRFSSSLKVG